MQGPPNDAAKGFEANWREAHGCEHVEVASLPWAHLLTHVTA